jgi:hypothetical protein
MGSGSLGVLAAGTGFFASDCCFFAQPENVTRPRTIAR